MKAFLTESYASTKKITGVDPSKPGNIRQILTSDKNFDTYCQSLSEGLSKNDVGAFRMLAENTRRALMENSMYSLNPYETLALPLLRVFYPRTIAKELVTVIPMDKPEIVRGFVRATFKKFGDATAYQAPSRTDISRGPGITVPVSDSNANIGVVDILNIAGLTADVAHIEKDFEITSVVLSGETVAVSVVPTVDGVFSANITNASGVSDTLTGRINYRTGVLETACVSGTRITKVGFRSVVSMEENTINARTQFSIDKLRIYAVDRTISTEWSIQMEQDVKALFNVEIQAELVSVIGQQIVLDIDREIVNSLIYTSENLNGASHSRSFDKTPPAGYAWGPKQWSENVLPPLNELSAQIYTDTNIASANVIACNPLDATVFENLNEFRYNGTSEKDGDMGYQSATVANGKWKVLVSSVVPQGKALTIYKPTEDIKAVYLFCPYVPSVLTPYPLGNKPSLSVLSRYGKQLVRPQGVGVLNITQSV